MCEGRLDKHNRFRILLNMACNDSKSSLARDGKASTANHLASLASLLGSGSLAGSTGVAAT